MSMPAAGTPGRRQYRRLRQPIDRRPLPAAPLVDAVRGYARRRQQPLDTLMRPWLLQALERAERCGEVTVLTGERVCDEVLGWHPRMVWGQLYDQTIIDPTLHRGPAPTGTLAAYRGGCRCLDCREANIAAIARSTARRAPDRDGGERTA
jgi:hypothetical protein